MPVELGAEVEGVAGVEDGDRFSMNDFASCEDRVVEPLEVVPGASFGFFEVAECAIAVILEQTFVDHTAEFEGQSKEAV